MNAKSNPGGFTPFNHGYLCQMLHSANDEELANVINDVKKEQQRRDAQRKMLYTEKITNAIREAVQVGYKVNFYSNDYFGSDDDSELLSIDNINISIGLS